MPRSRRALQRKTAHPAFACPRSPVRVPRNSRSASMHSITRTKLFACSNRPATPVTAPWPPMRSATAHALRPRWRRSSAPPEIPIPTSATTRRARSARSYGPIHPPPGRSPRIISSTWFALGPGLSAQQIERGLRPFTQSRDPQLLVRLKSEAGDALQEMARWRTNGWAYAARVILGRIAGIPEERVNKLVEGPLDAFLSEIGR